MGDPIPDSSDPPLGVDSHERNEDERVGGEWLNEDVQRLYRAWKNEKYAPEILPFVTGVIENVSELVEYVDNVLEEERADDEGNNEDQDPNDPESCLRCLDLERIRFLIRDYLRIRLWKLGQFPQHYLEPTNMVFLSDAERTYVKENWEAKRGFFDHRFLAALPQAKQSLDNEVDMLQMKRRPRLDKHVYARIIGDTGEIHVPAHSSQESGTSDSMETFPLHEGQKYLLAYWQVRRFFIVPEELGKVELI